MGRNGTFPRNIQDGGEASRRLAPGRSGPRLGLPAGLAAAALAALALVPPAPVPSAAEPAPGTDGTPPAASSRLDKAAEAAERERLNRRLIETASRIQQSERDLTAIEAQLAALEEDEKQKRLKLRDRHGQIKKLLSVLLRMGRNPPPVMITRRKDALHMVRSAKLVAWFFPKMRTEALTLAKDIEDLAATMANVRAERDKVKTETERWKAERLRLASLLAEKQKALENWQPEIKAVQKEIGEVSKTASTHDDLITESDRVVASRTGLGIYGGGTGAVAAAPGTGAAPQPPSSKETSLALLAPSGGGTGSPSRMKPARSFHLVQHQLPFPAQGHRILGFGDRMQHGRQSNGIIFQTRSGAQVVSPCDGWVIYANEFRSYGRLLIINAGDGYHVLLAGLSQIDVQPGQFVLAAEPVGSMSSTPSRNANRNGPVLYVEFRKDNKPIDPDPWWAQKVQG